MEVSTGDGPVELEQDEKDIFDSVREALQSMCTKTSFYRSVQVKGNGEIQDLGACGAAVRAMHL